VYPGYQLLPAEILKKECSVDTIAVGRIFSIDLVEEIIANKRADLVAVGKGLLRDANFVINEAKRIDYNIEIPEAYARAYRDKPWN
jgi:NADPH2 dehydrogenase